MKAETRSAAQGKGGAEAIGAATKPSNSSSIIAPDAGRVKEFCSRYAPSQLLAIPQEGGNPKACMAGDDATDWAVARNKSKNNLYFSINPLRTPLTKKANKEDIEDARWVYVDLDPRAGKPLDEERDRIALLRDNRPKGVPEPSLIIDSGGGDWWLWRLDGPSDKDGAEAASKALAAKLGGDSCHNVDRIARLPGTVNWPDAKKRNRGRVEALARVVRWNDDAGYSLDDLPGPDNVRPVGTDELAEAGASEWARALVASGTEAGEYGGDRSKALWAAVCELVRNGVPDELTAGAILDRNNDSDIIAHVYEQGSPRDYAVRQIKKAKAQPLSREIWPGGVGDKSGMPIVNYRNTKAALDNFGLACAYDLFKDRCTVYGDIPGARQGRLDDAVLSFVRDAIIHTYGFEPSEATMQTALVQRCMENAHDPVVEYFDGLKWDGVERVDRWVVDYLGAPDNELARAMGRKFLLGIVARARHPGCKFDTILVLEGEQGTNKSTALQTLIGEDYFNDSDVLTLKDGDQAQKMQGFMLHEIADLQSFRKVDVDKLKAFASRRIDHGRMAYAKFLSDVPRRSAFVGTTNDRQYLRDPTGNRRFWPLPTGTIDLGKLERDRDQLWAEAAMLEAGGESVVLPKPLWGEAAKVQADRQEDDPWTEALRDFRGIEYHDGNGVWYAYARTPDVFDYLNVPADRQNNGNNKRLRDVLVSLGWSKPTGPFRVEGKPKPQRGYRRRLKNAPVL